MFKHIQITIFVYIYVEQEWLNEEWLSELSVYLS